MNRRWPLVLIGVGFAILVVVFLVGRHEEPTYHGKALRYWVMRLGSDELHGAPKDSIAAIRAIGPKAVPFLLEWMPRPKPRRPAWVTRVLRFCSDRLPISATQKKDDVPRRDCIEIAWAVLGTEGKSAIPVLSRVISQPPAGMDDYSAWNESAKAISFLGPDAVAPMLVAATNIQGKHELWELLDSFGNLGTNGASAVPALIHWTNDPDYFVRSGVVSALGGIGKRADLAVPVLLASLHDSNPMVCRDAAAALGSFADDSDEVLPELVKILGGNDWQARGGALSGLGRIRSKPEIVVPLIAPYLSDKNSVVTRSAAYALRDLGSRAGLLALLRTTNNILGLTGIGDIVDDAVERISGEEEEKRRKDAITKLTDICARGEMSRPLDLKIEGRPLSQILNNEAASGPPQSLNKLLSLREVTNTQEDTIAFEVPLSYDAVTNIGTLRLLCDADPNEKPGSEAIVQKFERATNGNCRLIWDTSYDPPGQHFLQAELVIYRWHSHFQHGNYVEQETSLRGPLFPFLSTNTLQYFLHADTYTDYGAFFHVKLAQRVGSYSLKLTTLSGGHIHTITGSTTNGIVEVHWDLLDDQGKRYAGQSLNTSWEITFPDTHKPGSTNSTQAASRP